MICALLIDPDDSPDFPGNTAEVMGRPLAAYPLMAAKGARHIGRVYAQTESPTIGRVAAQYGAVVLGAPKSDGETPPGEEALVLHGYRQIVDDLKAEKAALELLVILFANTGAVNSELIETGIDALLEDPSYDSAATVSRYDRWTPQRAFRETPDGRLEPYAACVPDAGAPWFPDWGAVVARPRVLDSLKPGAPALSYLGAKVLPLKQFGGGPVDRQWQVPKMEYWLKKQGVRDNPRPEPQPKLKPAPKKQERR